MPLRHLRPRMTTENTKAAILLTLCDNERRNHLHLKGRCLPIRIILGIDGTPLNLTLVLLEILHCRLDRLARTARRRPKMKRHKRAHSSLVICTDST